MTSARVGGQAQGPGLWLNRGMDDSSPTYWKQYALSVLSSSLEAVGARTAGPDLLGGLRVERDEVEAILDRTRVEHDVASAVDPGAFRDALGGDDPFTDVCVGGGLTVEEAEVLAVLAAVELDQGLQRVVAWMQDDLTRPHVTVGLLRLLFPTAHWGVRAVGPGGALIRACYASVDAEGPFASRRVVLDEQVSWYLLGELAADPRLGGCARYAVVDDDGGADLVAVFGPDRTRRRQAAMAQTRGDRFVTSDVPASDEQWCALVREASLNRAGVVLEVDGVLPEVARRWIERSAHLPWAISSEREQPLKALPERALEEVPAGRPTLGADEWVALFGEQPRRHPLTAEQIRLGMGTYLRTNDLDETVRRVSVGPIDDLTTRIRPARTWSDLVLTPDRCERLQEIVQRHRHRGTVLDRWGMSAHASVGLVAVFHGPSGTGKTLAAEIIAGDLGVDLFRIDLSTVVSKYIGETEKNLAEVFDAAASTSSVLLFDEADALFGKRSDVTDARDRYANIEVSYLLQRLESYDGVAILTTNLPQNMDQAFLRRVHMSVDFVLPDENERRRLWVQMLTGGAPLGDIDFDMLARRFDLSGGAIRNCVYAGLSRAAAGDHAVSTADLLHGIRREYQKLGRLLPGEPSEPTDAPDDTGAVD